VGVSRLTQPPPSDASLQTRASNYGTRRRPDDPDTSARTRERAHAHTRTRQSDQGGGTDRHPVERTRKRMGPLPRKPSRTICEPLLNNAPQQRDFFGAFGEFVNGSRRKPLRGADAACAIVGRLRGRPPVITSDALLEIAREVFLERGIRATTAEVAERARVSEGTIFHRFGSKDALFRAAMRFDPEQIPEPLASLPEGGRGDLRATLTEMATGLLALGRVTVPMMMMSWSNPAGEYSIDKLLNRPAHGYRRAFLKLRDFFAEEVAAGRLDADPDALSRIFMGSLHHFCMTELIFSGDQAPPRRPASEVYVESLVDLMLRGASPRAEEPRKPGS
jgi:AcrR family transcriptional regulator